MCTKAPVQGFRCLCFTLDGSQGPQANALLSPVPFQVSSAHLEPGSYLRHTPGEDSRHGLILGPWEHQHHQLLPSELFLAPPLTTSRNTLAGIALWMASPAHRPEFHMDRIPP